MDAVNNYVRQPGQPRRHLKARLRERYLYFRSRPLLFPLLALSRRWPAVRVGSRLIFNSEEAFRAGLTTIALNRVSPQTTGGIVANSLESAGTWFAESGSVHRDSRRRLAGALGRREVDQMRDVWTPLLDEAVARLEAGDPLDVVALANAISGRTLASLLGRTDLTDADCAALAQAARVVSWRGVRGHLPDPWRLLVDKLRNRRDGSGDLAQPLIDVLGPAVDASTVVLSVATVTTMYAALPRVVAWAADADMWAHLVIKSSREVLVPELLRVVAPSPVLPRVAAEGGVIGGCPVHDGDLMLLVARHAVRAHDVPPSIEHPVAAATARLIFGVGTHACPGATLAREQAADVLAALAPLRPKVIQFSVDKHAALPAWRTLVVRRAKPIRQVARDS